MKLLLFAIILSSLTLAANGQSKQEFSWLTFIFYKTRKIPLISRASEISG